MKQYPENSCACKKCVAMCENRPCWAVPEDIEKIIAHDPELAKRLHEDYWVSKPDDIHIPSPAIRGYEGKRAPFIPQGICTFLKDGLCQLHDLGLKPLEGRVASHKKSKKTNKMHEDLRLEIVESWKTPEAKKTLKKWRRLVGIDEEGGAPPTGLEMLMELAKLGK